jgi:hypothetical protein
MMLVLDTGGLPLLLERSPLVSPSQTEAHGFLDPGSPVLRRGALVRLDLRVERLPDLFFEQRQKVCGQLPLLLWVPKVLNDALHDEGRSLKHSNQAGNRTELCRALPKFGLQGQKGLTRCSLLNLTRDV